MYTPPTVFIDMMSNIPGHLNLPFRTDRGTRDIQGEHETGKEKAWPAIIATPMACFELKLLEKQKAIDCGLRRRFRRLKDWGVLHAKRPKRQ